MSRVRLAAVRYLNAAPLVEGLAGDPAFELSADVPSRVAAQLHGGVVDVGLIPSIEYAHGDYAVAPGMAVASRGPVASVLLFLAADVARIRRVALDASSRTSAALCRILLRERLGRDPEYVESPPALDAMLGSADAALLIGDPALDAESGCPRLDLGEEWARATGLPFVWAFWAGRPGALQPRHVERLQQALLDGLARLPALAAAWNGGGRAERNEHYLRSNIAYTLGPAEQAGLGEFFRRAHGLGLIPRVPELRFLP